MKIKGYKNHQHVLMYMVMTGDCFVHNMTTAEAYQFLRPYTKGRTLQAMYDAIYPQGVTV